MTERLTLSPFLKRDTQLLNRASAYTVWALRLKNPFTLKGLPHTINGYTLEKPYKNNKKFKKYLIGVYRNKGQRYFVKIWNKKFVDIDYFDLQNEFYSGSVLYPVFKTARNQIRLPKPCQLLQGNGVLAGVFEFVEGKELSEYKKKYQESIFKQVVRTLEKESEKISSSAKKHLKYRKRPFYATSLIGLSVIAVLNKPTSIKEICVNFVKGMKYLFQNVEEKFVITHRDLNGGNILIKNKKIYLTDLSSLVLTYPQYDSTLLNISSKMHNSKQMMLNNFYIYFLHILFAAEGGL